MVVRVELPADDPEAVSDRGLERTAVEAAVCVARDADEPAGRRVGLDDPRQEPFDPIGFADQLRSGDDVEAAQADRDSLSRIQCIGKLARPMTRAWRRREREDHGTRTILPRTPLSSALVCARLASASGNASATDYALTPLGESLLPISRGIKDWAESHIDAVNSSRAAYDARRP